MCFSLTAGVTWQCPYVSREYDYCRVSEPPLSSGSHNCRISGEAVGVIVAVGVVVGVSVGVLDGVGVEVTVAVGLAVGVAVGVAVAPMGR